MQRSSTSVFLTITFNYNRGRNEHGEITYEDLSTPEDFTKNYLQICEDKKEFVDRRSSCFPAPTFSIKLSGNMGGNIFNKTYTDMDGYHLFLQRHKLWDQACTKTRKI